jgi:hypothetical protein
MQMLIELRNALNEEDDETVCNDITDLLRALRKRTDVTYPVASEIDTLLDAKSPPSAKTVRKQHSEPSAAPRWPKFDQVRSGEVADEFAHGVSEVFPVAFTPSLPAECCRGFL